MHQIPSSRPDARRRSRRVSDLPYSVERLSVEHAKPAYRRYIDRYRAAERERSDKLRAPLCGTVMAVMHELLSANSGRDCGC
jgi:hypothetical protein